MGAAVALLNSLALLIVGAFAGILPRAAWSMWVALWVWALGGAAAAALFVWLSVAAHGRRGYWTLRVTPWLLVAAVLTAPIGAGFLAAARASSSGQEVAEDHSELEVTPSPGVTSPQPEADDLGTQPVETPDPPSEEPDLDVIRVLIGVLPPIADLVTAIANTADTVAEATQRLADIPAAAVEELVRSSVRELVSLSAEVLRNAVLDDPASVKDAIRIEIINVFDSRFTLSDAERAALLANVDVLVESYIQQLLVDVGILAEDVEVKRAAGLYRIGGADRFKTAALIARDAYPNGASLVYIATGERFPDALAAAAITETLDAPLLLTRAEEVPASTRAALKQLGPQRVVVVGGPDAISDATFQDLQAILGALPPRDFDG